MRVTPMAIFKSVCFLMFYIVFTTIANNITVSDIIQMTAQSALEFNSASHINHSNEKNRTASRKVEPLTNEDEGHVDYTITTPETDIRNATEEIPTTIYDNIITGTIINKTDENSEEFLGITDNDNIGDTELINIDIDYYDENESRMCKKSHSVIISNYTSFNNGSLLDVEKNLLYPPEYFWNYTDKNNNTIIRGCICLLKTCIRKCCPEGMTFFDDDCAPSNLTLLYPFKLIFIDDDTYDSVNDDETDVQLIYGKPCTGEAYVLNPSPDYPEDMYYLLKTGILFVPAMRNHSLDDFCMEAIEEYNTILPLICITEEDVLVENKPIDDKEMDLLNPVGMIISLPFLLLTFLVYAVLSELKNIHGLSLMSYVGCLFIAYTFLAIVQIGGRRLSKEFCISCAFVIFFAFHASFFWLNVMCFDIWWTFSGLRPLRGSVKEREYKKFVMYSIYAWGSPLIMLVVCLLMDLVPGIPNDYIKPEFGKEKCWFGSKMADLAYFFGPIAIIVLCNIILFIATAIKLIHLKKETKMLKGVESKRHDEEAERQRFNLYLKLFIVMGVNWIMEVISWAVGGPEYLWYITDLGNTLQGVLIFVIFVWKRKIRRLLEKKFCPKLARTSIYEGSVKSRASASRTSSINNTYHTSINTQEHLVLKPLPNGAYRVSEVP